MHAGLDSVMPAQAGIQYDLRPPATWRRQGRWKPSKRKTPGPPPRRGV